VANRPAHAGRLCGAVLSFSSRASSNCTKRPDHRRGPHR
jgi:hypothetical protein